MQGLVARASAVVSSLARELKPQSGEITHITFKSSHIASPKDREMKSHGPAQQWPVHSKGPGQEKGTGAGSCAMLVAIPTTAEGFWQPQSPVSLAVPCVWLLGAFLKAVLSSDAGLSPEQVSVLLCPAWVPGCSTGAAGCSPAPSCPIHVCFDVTSQRE